MALIRYIDPQTGLEVVEQGVVPTTAYPMRTRANMLMPENPAIPPGMDRKMQGVLLRAEAMRLLANAAPEAVQEVGRIADGQRARGERVSAHVRGIVTSRAPGGCCGPVTPVHVQVQFDAWED